MRALIIACLTLVLSACGFHLRDSANLPFKSLYINLPPTSELRATIARNIAASSDTRIVESKEGSDAVLSVLGDTQVKTILSINSAGRVREYQLVRTFSYRVHDKAGNDLQPPARCSCSSRSVARSPGRAAAPGPRSSHCWPMA